MLYLESFYLPDKDAEDDFVLSYPPQLEMQCYDNNNVYPFKIFPAKGLSRLDFEPITLIYGGNGSGKSTLLNVIAEALNIRREAPFNDAPCMPDYLRGCRYRLARGAERPGPDSRIITSDDVFDLLLGIRLVNRETDECREALFEEYTMERKTPMRQLSSVDELDDFRRRLDTKRRTRSEFVSKRVEKNIRGRSNGESAFFYFTERIKDNALYLLDEPENSLSVRLQLELLRFIEESARFYNCQFIISTHSPFMLSMKGAKIYDLDSTPVSVRKWTELTNVRLYYDFFREHMKEFEQAENILTE